MTVIEQSEKLEETYTAKLAEKDAEIAKLKELIIDLIKIFKEDLKS